MREGTFTLQAGSEVPQRAQGWQLRYGIPENAQEIAQAVGANVTVTVNGDPAEVDKFQKRMSRVFAESFVLNHRQKVGKRLAAVDGSTQESVQAGILKHIPGEGVTRTGAPREPSKLKEERSTVDALLADMEKSNPQAAAQYRQRLEALRARKPKAAKAAETAEAPAAAKAAAPAGRSTAPAGGRR